MRYRPFTSEGLSSSAITLALTSEGGGADRAHQLVCTALECGVNSFSFTAGDGPAAEALREAVGLVGRRVLILMLQLDLDGGPLDRQVRTALERSGATQFDVVMLDRPAAGRLSPSDLSALEALRRAQTTRRLGLAADASGSEAYLAAIDFDVLAIRYNICSGWPERNLLKTAAQRGMTVIGYGHHVGPAEVALAPAARGLARLMRRSPSPAAEAYAFLKETHGWTPEQLTLAYALTEPGLASVIVEPSDGAMLERLSQAVERQLPASAAAQIEIARFAAAPAQSVG